MTTQHQSPIGIMPYTSPSGKNINQSEHNTDDLDPKQYTANDPQTLARLHYHDVNLPARQSPSLVVYVLPSADLLLNISSRLSPGTPTIKCDHTWSSLPLTPAGHDLATSRREAPVDFAVISRCFTWSTLSYRGVSCAQHWSWILHPCPSPDPARQQTITRLFHTPSRTPPF